uniref:NADAR domain-containing protein n=1 Tax=Meloidogyne incognita TaxID=6306 RepID=A0A914N7H6_MELIC
MISDINIDTTARLLEHITLQQPITISQPPEEIVGIQNQKIFIFYSPKCGFDNRFSSEFTILGRTFNTVDQYLEWQKARFFGDMEIASELLLTRNPTAIRRIGKRVRNYNQEEWSIVRNKVLYTGLWAKFTQNIQLFNQLRSTGDGLLAQASASEFYWSNGVRPTSVTLKDPSKWEGENYLGKLLMELRSEINTSIY